jgi:transcriptional regulator GlxA family with amidase domain
VVEAGFQGDGARLSDRMTTPVHVLALPGVELLDLAGPVQVFDTATRMGAAYEICFVGPSPIVTTAQGLIVNTTASLPHSESGHVILVPGVRNASGDLQLPSDVSEWLSRAHAAGARIASVCSAAFILGRAGLLRGRRATTHWSLTTALAHRYPEARVEEQALFVEDGNVITSAGVASGIDMALWIVERDHGPLMASRVARELVVYLRRDASHGQTSVYLDYRTHLNPAVHRAQDYLVTNFTADVTLPELAAVAGTSSRHLVRLFKESTGLTPAAYQRKLRLELVETLLSSAELSIEVIARRAGFSDARSLRRVWAAHHGDSPSSRRRRENARPPRADAAGTDGGPAAER